MTPPRMTFTGSLLSRSGYFIARTSTRFHGLHPTATDVQRHARGFGALVNTEISLENGDDFEPEVIESIDEQDIGRTGTCFRQNVASTDVLVSVKTIVNLRLLRII